MLDALDDLRRARARDALLQQRKRGMDKVAHKKLGHWIIGSMIHCLDDPSIDQSAHLSNAQK
jgi:hypothetical protein